MRLRLAGILLVALLAGLALGLSALASAGVSTTTTTPRVDYGAALISARTASFRFLTDYRPNSAVADGRSGWFATMGKGLVRLARGGSIDSSWGTPASRSLKNASMIVKAGSRLFVLVSKPPRPDRVEAFSVKTGARLWTSAAISKAPGSTASPVFALAASPRRVYVGGAFVKVGGNLRPPLVALDARTGKLLNWRPAQLGIPQAAHVNPYVLALTLSAGRLYVGGVFASVAGSSRLGIAALNPRTGTLLPWKPNPLPLNVGDVDEILAAGGEVITAGSDGFAAVSALDGHHLSWTSRLSGVASTFQDHGGILYLGGNVRNGFTAVDHHPRNNLAAMKLIGRRFASWAPNLEKFVIVNEIVPSGAQVLVIGDFTNSIG
jgi:outer membrane protein assembly factor BamB